MYDAADPVAEDDASSPSSGDDEASDFDADDALESSAEPSEDDEESDYSTKAPKGRKKPTPSKAAAAAASSPPSSAVQNGEKWRPGVKAGLGPGKQLVIKKPQARPAGKTPYQPETIHPNTLLFLGELKANNDRQWLKSKSASDLVMHRQLTIFGIVHDAVFRQAEQDWYSYVDKLTEKLIEIDDTVPELPVKDVVCHSPCHDSECMYSIPCHADLPHLQRHSVLP